MKILLVAKSEIEYAIARCLLGDVIDPALGYVHELAFTSAFTGAEAALITAQSSGAPFDALLTEYMFSYSPSTREDMRPLGYPLLELARNVGVRSIALVMTSLERDQQFEGYQQPESGMVRVMTACTGAQTRTLTVLDAPQAYVDSETYTEVDEEHRHGDRVITGTDWLSVLDDLIQRD
jgi:hypothetical protein